MHPVYTSIDTGKPGGDMTAVALFSVKEGIIHVEDIEHFRVHPLDYMRREIESRAWPDLSIPVLGESQSPEMRFAYSGAEFNDGHGPQAAANLARQRLEARLERKHDRRARYQRMYGRP